MRGLCNGLGPAMYGLIFYIFHVDLNEGDNHEVKNKAPVLFETYSQVDVTFIHSFKYKFTFSL